MIFELWEKIESDQVVESMLLLPDHINKEKLIESMIFNKNFEGDNYKDIVKQYYKHYNWEYKNEI